MGWKAQGAEDRVKALDLELSFRALGEMHFWMQRGGNRVVVGYLVHDENCSNPLDDCDGSGKILTKQDDRHFRSHVGHDPNSDPELDPYIEIMIRLRGDYPADQTCAIRDEDMNAARLMFDEALSQGKVGTAYAVALVDKHHSGLDKWDGEGTIDAVWIPDKSLLEHIDSFPIEKRREEARKCFESALNEYNSWAEGDCYGVVIDVFERKACGEYHHNGKESNSCWGYVGHKWAESSLDDEFKCNVKHYQEKARKAPLDVFLEKRMKEDAKHCVTYK